MCPNHKPPSEARSRQAVLDAAKSWLGTPYHSGARIKAVGVDCAQLPAAIYEEAGMIDHVPVETYSPQWHLHQSDERYLTMVMSKSRQIKADPKPGDFVLFKVARAYAHGAIVSAWPRIIHAVSDFGVTEDDASILAFAGKILIDREPRFFTLWPESD